MKTNIDQLMKKYGFKHLYLSPIHYFDREKYEKEHGITLPEDHKWQCELLWGSGNCKDNHNDLATGATGKSPDDAINNACEYVEKDSIFDKMRHLKGKLRYDMQHEVECQNDSFDCPEYYG